MKCDHSLRLGSLCALCGIELSEDKNKMYCLLHNTDSLQTTKEQAKKISKIRKKELDKEKKLILIIDLDQTVIHAAVNPLIETLFASGTLFEQPIASDLHFSCTDHDDKMPLFVATELIYEDIEAKRRKYNSDEFNKDKMQEKLIQTFYLSGVKYYIKVRPYTNNLLEYCKDYYEMHVYTMGNRVYAEMITKIIDPNKIFFDNRIISRDENLNDLQKNLNRLSMEHRNIVILDDRADVWKFCDNLINVKPYFFFKEGDINNPDILKLTDVNKNIKNKLMTCKTNDILLDKDILEVEHKNKIIYDNFIDAELSYIKNMLKSIYLQYFNETRNVKLILKSMRNEIFKDLVFYVEKNYKGFVNRKYIKKIIKHCGGPKKCKGSCVNYIVLIDEKNKENITKKINKYKCDVISYKWILECYYSLKRVEIGFYIIKSYFDDFIKELEEQI